MKTSKIITLIALAISFSGIAKAADDIVPGQYIVTVAKGHTGLEIAAQHAVKAKHNFEKAINGFSAQLNDKQVEALKHNPHVEKVEQDRVVHATDIQYNVPSWGLDRIDQQLGLDGAYGFDYTGAGVTAYIIDSGINFTHQEFGGRARPGFDAFGQGGVDCAGHGTHVAGTIGGSSVGIAKGVALVAVRVFDCAGSGTWSNVLAGIDWIIRNNRGPAVANMSLGGASYSTVDAAIANLTNAGVTVAVAAGNEGQDACNVSPARAPSAITVGATGGDDSRTGWSNYGSCVDIFAPGDGITSTYIGSDAAYAGMSGTSMATPHVTGVAALYLQANPTAKPAEVASGLSAISSKGVVLNSASANNNMLYSRVTVTTLPAPSPTPVPAPAPAPVPAPTPAPGDSVAPVTSITSPANGTKVSRKQNVLITADASDDVGVSKVEIYVNNSLVCTDASAPYQCSWKVPNSPGRTYNIQSRAYDSSGNIGTSGTVSLSSN